MDPVHDVFHRAAHELTLLADSPPWVGLEEAAFDLTATPGSRIHCAGVGKSGIAAHKLAATLSAHGVPAYYLDPVEALHGDLGQVGKFDHVIAVSASGRTRELARLATVREREFTAGIYGVNTWCDLTPVTKHVICTGVTSAADEPASFVPSASFLAACVVGDALALAVAKILGTDGPRSTHPGGALAASQPWTR